MKNGENFQLLYDLADKLNAAGAAVCHCVFISIGEHYNYYCEIFQWEHLEQLLMLVSSPTTCKLGRPER